MKIFLTIFTLFLSFSCARETATMNPLDLFADEMEINGNIFEPDREILHGADIRLVDDSILVIKNIQDEMYLTFINLNDNKVIKELIKKGRGPGELFAMDFCRHVCKDSLWVYDILLHTVYRVDVGKAIKDPEYQISKNTRFANYPPLTPVWTGNMFVGSGSTIDGRFSLHDRDGNYMRGCLKYSKTERYKEYPERVFATGFQGCYTINSDNRRIAFATFQSGNIHFFKYSDDNVETIKEFNFFEPKMTRNNWVCAFSYYQTKTGFCAIDSDQRHIYLLYSGRMMKDYPDDHAECEYLLVFDWDGKPIKKYKLNKPLISMCLSSKSNKIYGIAYLPETTIIQYDLE